LKILFVAMSDSVHTARWIRQLAGLGWDIRIFPSIDKGLISKELGPVEIYQGLKSCSAYSLIRNRRGPIYMRLRRLWGVRLRPFLLPHSRAIKLRKVIENFKPDVVHSLEFQAAGYLSLVVKKQLGKKFPPWILTNWGSDIYHFRQYPEHCMKIMELLGLCDYYSCECQRDVVLAKEMGLRGEILPVIPNAGGFDLAKLKLLRQEKPVSARCIVMLKGYQGWAGRALTAISALERCGEFLNGYDLVIYSPTRETIVAAQQLKKRTGMEVIVLPRGTSHEKILRMHGRARVSIGLSLTDGISTSFLEGIVMGSFPIQSCSSCADEWIIHGETGLIVPPEDVDAVAAALRLALSDDSLVDSAEVLNSRMISSRLDHDLIKEQACDFYRKVVGET